MEVTIHVKYCTPKGTEADFQSAALPINQAIEIAQDFQTTGRVMSLYLQNQLGQELSLKELISYQAEIKQEPHNITIYFDGGFDLDLKLTGLGFSIYYDQNDRRYRLRKNARVTEITSNNEAEYAALELALKELAALEVHHQTIRIRGDSQVVINQLTGQWASLDQTLNKWADRIDHLLAKSGLCANYELIDRNTNREADRLASQALKDVAIDALIELKAE